jgi:SAM-dependent methyltransferase
VDNGATPIDSALKTFPAPLVCPTCRSVVTARSVCAGTGRPCVTIHADMPRFLLGQEYWGETGSEKMRQLLQGAREVNWRTALQRYVGGQPISQHLLSPVRADLLHAMPWDRIRDVLDVGAGMGFMSCDMALYADSVVALEAVPERAEFVQIRARQDNLRVFPIIASAMAMPFPDESFDLITLNGVFEYIGLWGDGDPKQLQEKFLISALRLLRPGGYLYVGIETRYATSAFLGARDHSGLAFTSLMPRALADLYCRLRARPFYGAEHVVRGYRTYTYTPSQYRKMFLRAGYRKVFVQGVFDGYNRQRVLYDINDHAGRKAVLSRVNPPASMAGVLRRALTENRLTYRTLEGEVVILAQKDSVAVGKGPMLWSEVLAPNRTVVQLNVPYKTLGILCSGGFPVEVLEVEKKGHEDAKERQERSFKILQTLQQQLAPEVSGLSMRWPVPMGTQKIAGRIYRRYEYIQGQSLSTLLLPKHYDHRTVSQLISRMIVAYVSFCGRLSNIVGSRDDQSSWTAIEKQLEDIEVSDDFHRDFRAAVDAARATGWRLSAVHGDFTAGNLIVTPSGDFVLVDWEHFLAAYPIGADLLRFLQDALLESARLPIRVGRRFRHHLRQVVNAALENCGYSPRDYHHLHALYIGHQIAALGGDSRAYAPLIEAYRARHRLLGDDLDDA